MITFIIKSSFSLIVLFGLYWFLLRKEKLFVFNRFFLILSIAFSLVLPLITIPVNFQIAPQLNEIIPSYNNAAPEVIVADNIVPRDLNISQPYVEKETTSINIFTILLLFYISGVIIFLIRFSRNIYLILKRSKLSEKISSQGYRIVLTDDKMGPCCFFSNIFLNKDDYLNGKIDKELLNHELEHVRQSHTIDIILIEIVKIFYWFNPINLLYDRAIRINHEYLADNGVINDNSDIKTYTDKLLSFISCSSNMSLTSGSNNSFTKLRLMMMMKSRSGSFKYGARIAVTLCMVIVFFTIMSFKESKQHPKSPNLLQVGAREFNKSNKIGKDYVYEKAEIMPQYPGGDNELRNVVQRNINYPQSVISQKVQGIVYVRFVVNKEGSIENVEILKKIHPALDVEVLRALGKLDRFTPGKQGGMPVNVYYSLLLKFSI